MWKTRPTHLFSKKLRNDAHVSRTNIVMTATNEREKRGVQIGHRGAPRDLDIGRGVVPCQVISVPLRQRLDRRASVALWKEGFFAVLQRLNEAGLNVIVVRDTPRSDGRACLIVWRNQKGARAALRVGMP